MQVNSFNMADADIEQSGLFLDPALAMVNHSCVPNAFVQFAGRKAMLRAYQEIKKDEEVEISYIGKPRWHYTYMVTLANKIIIYIRVHIAPRTSPGSTEVAVSL